MANSASDARASEQELRRKLLEARAVDVMVAVGPNMFYTVTLPCTLWFMDKAKAKLPPCPPSPQPSPSGRGGFQFQGLVEEARMLRKNQTPTEAALWELLRDRKLGGTGGEGLAANVPEGYTGARYSDTVLFIDARHIYRQIDRAHRDWTDAQIGFLANVVRLYRGKEPELILGGEEAKAKLAEIFPSPSTGEGQGGWGFCLPRHPWSMQSRHAWGDRSAKLESQPRPLRRRRTGRGRERRGLQGKAGSAERRTRSP
jgi:type I restriction enzyme M protein